MQIKATPSFLRQANKLFKRNPALKERFKQTLEKMLNDYTDPLLKTHKLTGDLKELWSCSVTYEIRLIFKITGDGIELIDVGTHNEVY
jgi:addiction module RelE/StbE family toxin